MNLEVANNLLDNKEVDYAPIELAKVIELCFDHLGVLFLLSCPHCDVHARWEMNLI